MGHGFEGAGEEGGNIEVYGDVVQGGVSDGAVVRERELGDHRGNDECVGGILSSDFKEAHKKDSPLNYGGRLAIAPDRICYIVGRSVVNAVICTEAAHNNCRIYCNTSNIITVYQGGEDAVV